jgi:FMN phosphatase YigB (HAD superfamily)
MSSDNQVTKVLFVDFNGVISYNDFWYDLNKTEHPLHSYKQQIEDFLFKTKPDVIEDWMLGKYTSEQIHQILVDELNIPYNELFEEFESGCRNIDISLEVLGIVKELKEQKVYYCILSTGNMDCFDRFTVPSNPILQEIFDEIENSCNIGLFKTSNNGQYFSEKVSSLGANISECVVIDDSKKVCRVFESLGGKAINAYGIEECVNKLSELLEN